ncbi:peptidoglycan D,D-transpeptidase FtsI family protein [Vagococcus elongatus]
MNRRKFATLLFGAAIGVFFIFVARFNYIVLVGKVGQTSLDRKTQELYQGSSVVKAKRGTIYDRDGEVIAEDATSYSLYAVLDEEYLGQSKTGKNKDREKLFVQEKDKNNVAEILESNTNLGASYVLEQLNKNQKQVEFGPDGKQLSIEQKNSIEKELEALEIKGVYFNEHVTRSYPNEVFSSHLVGFAQFPKNEDEELDETKGLVGQMGIEQAENDLLAGENGEIEYLKDKNQREIPTTRIVKKEAKDGKDIYTTLDVSLGLYLEDKMNEVQEKYNPYEMTAMLVEAKTGNIVAASQRPTFNPETKEGLEGNTDVIDEIEETDESDEEGIQWYNLLTQMPFEPGSTMKAFTVASSIDLGQFDQNGFVKTGVREFEDGTKIYDWDNKGVGTVTYRQAFAYSSNVAMITLQERMGTQWEDYIKRFGFLQPTGTNLLNENPGYLPDMTNVINAANTSFGQGISVTPFQMVQGYTAIANQGTMLKPNYIKKIVDGDKKTTEIGPKAVGQPISETTASQTLDLMTSVVEDKDYGTGQNFGIEGYRVSAKTGTAQIFNNKKGAYYKDRYIFSVAQIAPTEDPKYIMYVTVKLDNTVGGGEVVAEISNPVLKMALDLDTK